jgi:hypothetical protein
MMVMQNNCQVCSIDDLASLKNQPINNVDKIQEDMKLALEGKWPGWGEISGDAVPLVDETGVFTNPAKAQELQASLKFHVMHNEAALFPFFDPLLQVYCFNMFVCVLVCF